MAPGHNIEQQFSEDIERLARGSQPSSQDADYASMLEFARHLMALRDEPRPAFASRLREDLMLKMAEQDIATEARPSWFMRLFGSHSVRLAVVSGFVVLAAVGLVWRAGFFSSMSSPPPADGEAAVTQDGVPEEPQAEAAEEEKATGPDMIRSTDEAEEDEGSLGVTPSETPLTIRAEAVPAAVPGEDVTVYVFFDNTGTEGMTLAPFPPPITIRTMDTDAVVRTFEPGASSLALSSMESTRYDITWDQTDDAGRQVDTGAYAVDIGQTTFKPEKYGAVSLEAMRVAIIEITAG